MSVQEKTPEQKIKETADAKFFYGEKLFDSMSSAAREKLTLAVARLNRAIELEEESKISGKPDRRGDMSFALAVKAEMEAFGATPEQIKAGSWDIVEEAPLKKAA